LPKQERMTRDELEGIVNGQIRSSVGYLSDDISSARADLVERYLGEPYGDEQAERSHVVSSDVSDTIEWIMPSIMKVFTAGDRVVQFEPQNKEDVEAAEQETDAVNYVFERQNHGFLVMHTWFKDALLGRNGVVKSYWDEREESTTEKYSGLTMDELADIMRQLEEKAGQDGKVEVVLHEEREDEFGPVRDVQLRIMRKIEQVRVVPVPPEEFLIAPRWNSIFLDECPFLAHRRKMTESDLIAAGFDPDQVREIPSASDDLASEERTERFDNEGAFEDATGNMPAGQAMREVWVTECYPLVDWNGDGIAERVMVTIGGTQGQILKRVDDREDVEEVNGQPFDAITPILMSHKFFGRSVAELVTDIQRINTVLLRQMLDNLYLQNNARTELPEGAIGDYTIDDYLNPRVGSMIRTAQPGMMREIAPTPVIDQALAAIEYMNGVRENRTGVTRYNQGLDAETLNKTARGIQQIMDASREKLALIARVFAETGVSSLFRRIHRLLQQHSRKAMTMRLL
jgi:hypothetical protein